MPVRGRARVPAHRQGEIRPPKRQPFFSKLRERSESRHWLALLLPLAMILFPEEIGNLTGYYKTGYVNVQTPGAMVSFLGWCFLVGLPVLLYFVRQLVGSTSQGSRA